MPVAGSTILQAQSRSGTRVSNLQHESCLTCHVTGSRRPMHALNALNSSLWCTCHWQWQIAHHTAVAHHAMVLATHCSLSGCGSRRSHMQVAMPVISTSCRISIKHAVAWYVSGTAMPSRMPKNAAISNVAWGSITHNITPNFLPAIPA